MTRTGFKDKLTRAVAVVMIAAALCTTAATLMRTAAMAATSGDNCLTGLCCAADRWWKCAWVPNWRFKYDPIAMKCC